MHATVAAVFAGVVAVTPATAQVARPTPQELFVAVLEGAYDIPPFRTPGTGTVEVTWTGAALRFQVHLDSIRGVTGASLHIGPVGDLTPAVAELFDGVRAGPVSGLLSSGTLTARDLHGTSIDELLQALRDNGAYVTVHALSLGGGALRGQLYREPVVTSRRSGDHA